MKKSNRCVG